MNTCYICEYSWIIIGKKIAEGNATVKLSEASVVRRWTNGKGIGGIAKAENKNEYVLDAIGDVIISKSKVIFAIPCEW